MKPRAAVRSLGALAHEHRLAIYRLLIKQGPAGLPAGTVGNQVGLTPSSLTFHLQALQHAGLIKHARLGRQLFYSADFSAMNDLVGYLTDECCVESAVCVPECAPARKTKTSNAA
jgi:ArsR family transcriptional regulator, arsenate/arsenite/antimonite-responsive transcriptional repressor